MVKEDKATWKSNYFLRLIQHLDEYEKCFIVKADNVGSKQMQSIRATMRELGNSSLLFGKNTMMRKAIRGHLENNPNLEKLLPCLKGNVGFVFTKGDLNEVRKSILENKVKAPARAGAIAPCTVVVPKQNTGMGPEKTSFFQALNIQTKITRGTVEIMNDVKLLNEGEKVGPSEATLLNMLKLSPFNYGLIIEKVYESGTVYDPAILDIDDGDLRNRFIQGVCNIASVCLEIGYPTVASVPHSIANAFKNLLAIAVETDYTFKQAEMTKAYLADPSAFASASVAPAATKPAAADTGTKAAKEEAKEESEEGSDDDMGFGLFD